MKEAFVYKNTTPRSSAVEKLFKTHWSDYEKEVTETGMS